MELPNNDELYKQVFFAQPKAHHIKYAEKHRVVKSDMLKLKSSLKAAMTLMCAVASMPDSWMAK